MNAGRRGLLGAAAALGIGPRLSRAEVGMPPPQPAVMVQTAVGRGLVGETAGCANPTPRRDPRHDLFHKLMDERYRLRRRLEARLELTGGVPPGILACKSWRPWFAAAAIERWRDEHTPDMSLVERVLRQQVFGDDA